ncbi:MAG: electron transfer flavoprotein subunit beta/FixA family protein [Deltaproteobacteria bacterium]|nr:electron transfer flavoprotein subunit beta/FixA family protein [Deltaproteobacteria bacterium]
MRIITCLKEVPDRETRYEINPAGSWIKEADLSFEINECDEYALEEAIALKRAHGGEVTVLTMGSITTQDILYLALAKGADRAVRIDVQLQDPQAASAVLAAALKKLEYDLVLTGTQSRDTLSGVVGIAIAERLEIPYAFAVTQVEADGDKAIKVRKELGGGRYADVRLSLPALLCVQTGIQPLTYVPPARMLRARQQAVRSLSLGDLVAEEQIVPRGYRFLDVFPPERTGQAQFLEGNAREVAATLLAKIKEVL